MQPSNSEKLFNFGQTSIYFDDSFCRQSSASMLKGVTGLLGILPPTIRGHAQASETSDRPPVPLSSLEERESDVRSQGFSLLKGRILQPIPEKVRT